MWASRHVPPVVGTFLLAELRDNRNYHRTLGTLLAEEIQRAASPGNEDSNRRSKRVLQVYVAVADDRNNTIRPSAQTAPS